MDEKYFPEVIEKKWQQRWDEGHAFEADRGNFHELAVPHFVGDGEDTTVREVDVLDPHAVRLQDFAGGHGVHSDVGQQPAVYGGRQSCEETVVQMCAVRQKPDRR